jgi:hypothetical protein
MWLMMGRRGRDVFDWTGCGMVSGLLNNFYPVVPEKLI